MSLGLFMTVKTYRHELQVLLGNYNTALHGLTQTTGRKRHTGFYYKAASSTQRET